MKLAPIRDARLLAALHARAFDDAWDESAFASLLASPGVEVLVAEDDGQPRGLVLWRAVADEAEILTLGVAAGARRHGVGRALLAAAAEAVAKAGAATLFLEVDEGNTAARALYARAGFAEVGRRKAYYARPDGGRSDALAMRRALNRPAAGPYDFGPVERSGSLDRLEKLCAERGLRMTEQRRVVARVLSAATDHPDVEELHRRAHALDPHISIATVYRTVRLFEESGILTRHDFRQHRSRYEEAGDSHHDHLIDMKSGEVIEFVDEEIEALQKRIAERLGYRLIDHRLELYAVPANDS